MNIHAYKTDKKTQFNLALRDRAGEQRHLILETIKATIKFARSLLSEREEAFKAGTATPKMRGELK